MSNHIKFAEFLATNKLAAYEAVVPNDTINNVLAGAGAGAAAGGVTYGARRLFGKNKKLSLLQHLLTGAGVGAGAGGVISSAQQESSNHAALNLASDLFSQKLDLLDQLHPLR